ncbi:MAG: DUF2089 domain-containing protein [Anaerolineales bacterium]|nr:DUF2089 domain-containing protein [Anaerolineales bacterium]MCB9127564.1 DUF2089 domain-containing protein [Ardenticatenales bacterium]
MNPMPEQCPLCESTMEVHRLYCGGCQITIEGRFDPQTTPAFDDAKLPVLNRLARLSAEQLEFLEAFVRAEGKFTRLEEEIGFSYPTLRARFSEIVQKLGGQPQPDRQEPTDRKQVLDDLAAGRIDATVAIERMRKAK